MNDASNPMPVPIAPDGSSPSPLHPGRKKPAGALHRDDVRTLDDSPGDATQAAEDQPSPADVGGTYGGLRRDETDGPVERKPR
jgi:hypothetical protein